MTTLVWFRNDLRLTDNPALFHAGENNTPRKALFVLCEEYVESHPIGPKKLAFLHANLKCLQADLSACGIELSVLKVKRAGDIPSALVHFCHRENITEVYANREYPLDEKKRDKITAQKLHQNNIKFHAYHDRALIPPGMLKTAKGDFYKVFTPFSKQWKKLADSYSFQVYLPPEPAQKANNPQNDFDRTGKNIDHAFAGLLDQSAELCWPAGEKAALQALHQFCQNNIDNYHLERDFPALSSTSSLSPYLSLGVLSPKQCFIAAQQASRHYWQENEGVKVWLEEIIWRDFYMHVVAAFPRLSCHKPMQTYTQHFPWRANENDFLQWCEGRTGIPLVDAAMRQLNHTGWMHNRLRMVAAMFLSKNLRIDWRWGEAYFARQLIDFDFSANNGGWQWSASTGTDAAPYFRIMNPNTQSQRFDPEGTFIRRWVPELAHLSNKAIHNPGLQANYPAPIVDVKATRKHTIELFKGLQQTHT